MTDDILTAGELKDVLKDAPDDEKIYIQMSGAVGDATKAFRNVEGVVVKGR